MKYHLHLVTRDSRYTDYTCGGFDATPDFLILYDNDPVTNSKAKIQKLVGLKDMMYVDITEIEGGH